MSDTVSELRTYLIAQGVGSSSTVFTDRMPTTPDTAWAVIAYPGAPPEVDNSTSGVAFERPRVQVLARAAAAATARANAQSAWNAIAKIANTTLSSTWYLKATPLQSPFKLREDESGRTEFAFNVAIDKYVSA